MMEPVALESQWLRTISYFCSTLPNGVVSQKKKGSGNSLQIRRKTFSNGIQREPKANHIFAFVLMN